MRIFQQFGGREHTPSGTYFFTDLHGFVGTVISIGEIGDETEVKGVKVLGSTYEVAFGQPDGSLQKIDLKIRLSGVKNFETAIRARYAVPPGISVATVAAPLSCTLTSTPLDMNEAALPTVTMTFKAVYLGGMHGADRKSNDPIERTLKLQLTTPALVQ